MCMPKVHQSPPLGIAILSSADNKKGRWTVSTLWQHPGWFSTDKGTFFFLVQIWFRTWWYEAYCSAKLRAALRDSTDLVFYSSPTGQLAVYISWQSVNPPLRTPLNSLTVLHVFFRLYFIVVTQKKSHSCNQEVLLLMPALLWIATHKSFACQRLQQLTDPLCHFKKPLSFEVGVRWHFRSWGVGSSSSSRKLSHLQRKAVWLS